MVRRLEAHDFDGWVLDGLMDAFEFAALTRLGANAKRRGRRKSPAEKTPPAARARMGGDQDQEAGHD